MSKFILALMLVGCEGSQLEDPTAQRVAMTARIRKRIAERDLSRAEQERAGGERHIVESDRFGPANCPKSWARVQECAEEILDNVPGFRARQSERFGKR